MSKSLSEPKTARRLLTAGAVATASITLFALIDPVSTRLIAAQVQAGYPGYSSAEIDRAAVMYVGILVIVGVLGALGWGATILLSGRHRRLAFWLGLSLGAIGLLVAGAALATTDTSGTIGLAPVFGWLLLVPCGLGLTALIALRRAAFDRTTPRGAADPAG
ncbi:hypothetical protein [Microbacterium sp. NPDC058345]|uniref:hypothetical protein n=1 Tax=Microbacterium sp. NPDC058345 TaxID=3346455 RepID=UPI003656AA38